MTLSCHYLTNREKAKNRETNQVTASTCVKKFGAFFTPHLHLFPRATYYTIVPSTEGLYCLNRNSNVTLCEPQKT